MLAAQQVKYGMHTVQLVGDGSGCIVALIALCFIALADCVHLLQPRSQHYLPPHLNPSPASFRGGTSSSPPWWRGCPPRGRCMRAHGGCRDGGGGKCCGCLDECRCRWGDEAAGAEACLAEEGAVCADRDGLQIPPKQPVPCGHPALSPVVCAACSLLRYVEGSDGIELHFEGREEPVKAKLLVATVRFGGEGPSPLVRLGLNHR